ncbi:MAG: acyl-CoA thioesterase II [Burkholderiaceae bacterium]
MNTEPIIKDLIGLLTLEQLDTNLFRGQSLDIGTKRVFGGQVLGQSLAAANMTVDSGTVHSMHAYFLRAGDHNAPIIYEVDRQRDGRTYASRRVVAIQHGRPILNMAASFQQAEQGLSHQATMPDVPRPETLKDIGTYRQEYLERMPESRVPRFMLLERPFEFRPVEAPPILDLTPRPPKACLWFKTVGPLPDDENLHRNMLAYVSDYSFVSVATLPHGKAFEGTSLQLASLDHAIWFQRPFRMDEWLLYEIDSPSATNGRGLVQGRIFRQDGVLVAVVAQEGVMRVYRDPAGA